MFLEDLLKVVQDGEVIEIVSEEFPQFNHTYKYKIDIPKKAYKKEVTDIMACNEYEDAVEAGIDLYNPILVVTLGEVVDDEA